MITKHRYASPKAEHDAIKRIWLEVQEKTGVHVGDKVEIDWFATLQGAINAVGISEDNVVGYALGVTDNLSDQELHGILAHELGHASEPDRKAAPSKEHELAADDWAAAHGYGPELIKALQNSSKRQKDPQYFTRPDGVHPDVDWRIARLQKAVESYEHQIGEEKKAA
jgi:hypothetical protein